MSSTQTQPPSAEPARGESGLAVKAVGLSKTYARHYHDARTLKEILTFRHSERSEVRKPLQALRDVSLEIRPGEMVGVIGANGSGKSTLLRILAGITEPTAGSVEIQGRVGSLLELGAGFQPQLSGLENIYLNAAVMGIPDSLVDERLEEIIDFAGFREFIHTPVRSYSSGMYIRLGFSIAVHLNPDILLVDEILGVGDAPFQSAGYERMVQLIRQGVATVVVTHDLNTVEALCDRTLWLDHGRVEGWGETQQVLGMYRRFMFSGERLPALRALDRAEAHAVSGMRMGTGEVTVDSVRFFGPEGRETKTIVPGEPWAIELDCSARQRIDDADIVFQIEHEGQKLACCNALAHGFNPVFAPGRSTIRIEFSRCHLNVGTHTLSVSLVHRDDIYTVYDLHIRIHRFNVLMPAPSFQKPLMRAPLEFTLRS